MAIAAGYRHIDTAYAYENEKIVGETLHKAFASGVVKREEMFITTKLWSTFHRSDLVKVALEKSLANLQLDYVDLYLMHWPFALSEQTEVLLPRDEHQELIPSKAADLESTWLAMVQLVETGLCRGVGVSNFNEQQLDRILAVSPYVPIALQIECHPYLTQKSLSKYCASHGITVIAYSPLGTPNRPNALTGEPNLFADQNIAEMSQRLHRTQAQIMIRYQVQRGHCTIPKSVTPERIISNYKVFDFELSENDMSVLDGLNYDRRFVPMLM